MPFVRIGSARSRCLGVNFECSAAAAGGDRRAVVLPRRQHAGGHHRVDSRWPASVWGSSTSTAPNALRQRCIRVCATLPLVRRDGRFTDVDVTDLVPGDVIRLALGEVVPADMRLIEVSGLECNESILTGESTAAEKSLRTVGRRRRTGGFDRSGLHGNRRQRGRGHRRSSTRPDPTREFGRIAAGLGTRQPETDVPGGAAPLLLPAAVGGARVDRRHPGHQSAPAPAGHRLGAVRPGHRGRHHASAAARRGQHQPGDRRASTGQAQSAGQEAGVHRGPRRHRHADHRQDGHA